MRNRAGAWRPAAGHLSQEELGSTRASRMSGPVSLAASRPVGKPAAQLPRVLPSRRAHRGDHSVRDSGRGPRAAGMRLRSFCIGRKSRVRRALSSQWRQAPRDERTVRAFPARSPTREHSDACGSNACLARFASVRLSAPAAARTRSCATSRSRALECTCICKRGTRAR
jgi:hypothetical protein